MRLTVWSILIVTATLLVVVVGSMPQRRDRGVSTESKINARNALNHSVSHKYEDYVTVTMNCTVLVKILAVLRKFEGFLSLFKCTEI